MMMTISVDSIVVVNMPLDKLNEMVILSGSDTSVRRFWFRVLGSTISSKRRST